QVEAVGRELTRYGLGVVVAWVGPLKVTAYEAGGGRPFGAPNPPMRWGFGVIRGPGFSAVPGGAGVATAPLLAPPPLWPPGSPLGSAVAVGMFLTTLSFLVTTPGVWASSAGGFPALSGSPGQFLIKDLALLGIALWTLGETWKASQRRE